jgi:hypothetical protein
MVGELVVVAGSGLPLGGSRRALGGSSRGLASAAHFAKEIVDATARFGRGARGRRLGETPGSGAASRGVAAQTTQGCFEVEARPRPGCLEGWRLALGAGSESTPGLVTSAVSAVAAALSSTTAAAAGAARVGAAIAGSPGGAGVGGAAGTGVTTARSSMARPSWPGTISGFLSTRTRNTTVATETAPNAGKSQGVRQKRAKIPDSCSPLRAFWAAACAAASAAAWARAGGSSKSGPVNALRAWPTVVW